MRPTAGGAAKAEGSPTGGLPPIESELDRDLAVVDLDLHAVPDPWDYNPSSWFQRVRVSVIAVIGVLISAYLGLYQWGLIDGVWEPFFGSGTTDVLRSEVSHTMTRWIRVPDAVLGSLAYLGDILFALAGSTRRWQFRPWLVVLFGLDVIPLGLVSAILVVLQGTVVGSWCTLCLFTALISLTLIVLAYDEVWSSLLYLRAAWRRADGLGEWWGLFWGRASEAGHLAALDVLGSPRAVERRRRLRERRARRARRRRRGS